MTLKDKMVEKIEFPWQFEAYKKWEENDIIYEKRKMDRTFYIFVFFFIMM